MPGNASTSCSADVTETQIVSIAKKCVKLSANHSIPSLLFRPILRLAIVVTSPTKRVHVEDTFLDGIIHVKTIPANNSFMADVMVIRIVLIIGRNAKPNVLSAHPNQ